MSQVEQDTIALKPCPFCGTVPTIKQFSSGHSGNGVFTASFKIKCEKCKVEFTRNSEFQLVNGQPKFIRNGYDEVVSLWNTRAE